MIETIKWRFPCRTCHRGIPMGNGRTGLFVWGEGTTLKLTFGRADLWDHRGGMRWKEEQNFEAIRSALEKRDEAAVKAMFREDTAGLKGVPPRPSLLPFGRLELTIPDAELKESSLSLSSGVCTVFYRKNGAVRHLEISVSHFSDLVMLEFSDDETFSVVRRPSYQLVPELKEFSFPEPEFFGDERSFGWIMRLPADPPCGIRCLADGKRRMFVRLARSEKELFREIPEQTMRKECTVRTQSFWRSFRRRIPSVTMSCKEMEEHYAFGMYKYACYANPELPLPPGTLQGPWIADHRLPPWSGDYHFNINVQMCCSPALPAGLSETLPPLFRMILSWKELLRENARKFIGIENGYLLPHAVDDRGTCMGGFWPGALDHGCTTWVSCMMFNYVRSTNDTEFLRKDVFDFMCGAFNVYYAMMKRMEDGTLSLPLSVSPEFREGTIDAWGRDASFQLAACRRLTLNLQEAARMLSVPPDPRWKDVLDHLPEYTTAPDLLGHRSLAVWAGQPLDVSHRHHSHLGGIYPFETLHKDRHAALMRDSLNLWNFYGTVRWTAWSFPWAAILCARTGNPGMAQLFFILWHRAFVSGERFWSYISLLPGIGIMSGRDPLDPEKPELIGGDPERPAETMQLDSGFGFVRAIQEMLLQECDGVLHVFAGIARTEPRCEFRGMHAPCGVTVSARMEYGVVTMLKLHALRDTVCRLSLPEGGIREIPMKKAQNIQII